MDELKALLGVGGDTLNPKPVFYDMPKPVITPELQEAHQKAIANHQSNGVVAQAEKASVLPKKATKKPVKKDYPATVAKMLKDIPEEAIPVREKGESGIAYSIRLAEHKDKQKGK
jgi:hypothetical protein